MNLKSFLKFNWNKIITFLILFGGISFLSIVPAIYQYKCLGCIYIEYHNFWYTLIGHGFKNLASISIMLLEILVSYILACVVVIIFNRSKK